MKFLTNIDMNKNQVLNLVLQNLATAPSSPAKGQAYYNTTDNRAYLWNNSMWVDLTELNMSGVEIVTAINASASLIDDNNLSANVNDAITKKHTQNSDTGTSSATFVVGASGVKFKNATGNLQVRNNADSAFANVEALDVTTNGVLTVKGSTVLGDLATTDTTVINGVTTVKSGSTKGAGSASVNVFQVIDATAVTPLPLFEVRQNGDTVIAGILTVNGTGTSTFAGDVSIGGKLTVADTSTASADLSGTDLTLSGNLVVNGNTTLGDNSGTDITNINGVTTIKSSVTKGTGSSSIGVLKVVDSADASLFEVKQNGDTVIGGSLTVNGTGGVSSSDLTLTGNLVVNGNTTLGNAGTDTVTVPSTLTVTGTTVLPTATTIGGVTQVNISDAVTKRHSQNTDTGTSSVSFQVGTSGVKIKNNGGTELQVRNAGDTAMADLRVNNLIVDGTTTTINSNQVDIGDSNILLNSDVATSATNSDGGLSVKRLKVDNTTRADAVLNFNNTTGRWETAMGAVASPLIAQLVNKAVFTIGNASLTSIAIVHNFGTRDCVVSVRETTTYNLVQPDVVFTDLNTITINFAVAPATNEFTVIVVG